MKRVIILKSIFCPTYEYMHSSMDSIESIFRFINYYKLSQLYKITLILFGWYKCKKYNDIFMKYIENINNDNMIRINLYFHQINYGKCWYLKKISFLLNKNNIDYYLYLDHDINLTISNNIFNLTQIISMYNVVYINQYNDCRHQPDVYSCIKTIDNFKLGIPSDNSLYSLAAGCFMMNKYSFDYLSELNIISVYGLEEVLISKIFTKYNIKPILVINYYVNHPFDANILFKKWKLDLSLKVINYINNMNNIDFSTENNIHSKTENNIHSKFYNTTLESSINFWNYHSI